MSNTATQLLDRQQRLFIDHDYQGLRNEFIQTDFFDYWEMVAKAQEMERRYNRWKLNKDRIAYNLRKKLQSQASYRMFAHPKLLPMLFTERQEDADRFRGMLRDHGLRRIGRIKEPTAHQKEWALLLCIRLLALGLQQQITRLPTWVEDIHRAYERDLVRVSTSEWNPVVWAKESWFMDSPHYNLHRTHVSVKNPALIAYTQSVDKLVRDIQTPVKPGRYLQQFFSDVLDEEEIKMWAERQMAYCNGGTLSYIENTDPDDWEWVYENGPQSCMKGESAVRCYARPGNHLRLAYINLGTRDAPAIVARAIVREDTKEYVRAYPNTDSTEGSRWHDRMEHLLTEAGYTWGNLDGIKIDTEELDAGRWICPYIDHGDGGSQQGDLNIDDQGHFFRLGRGDYSLDETQGYIEEEGTCCDRCGDREDPDEMTAVDDGDRSICPYCLENHYTYAYGRRYQDYFPNDDVIYCESNGEWYVESYADRHDVYQCQRTDNWYKDEDLVDCVAGRYEGDMIHADEAMFIEKLEGHIWVGDAEEDYAGVMQFDEHLVDAPDGARVHVDDLDDYIEAHCSEDEDEDQDEDTPQDTPQPSTEPQETFALAA